MRLLSVALKDLGSAARGSVVEACSGDPSVSKAVRSKKRMFDSSSTTKIFALVRAAGPGR
jgi:hypothetical protein